MVSHQNAIVIGIVRRSTDSALVPPQYIVVASLDVHNRLNCRVRPLDLFSDELLPYGDTMRISSISFNNISRLGRLVGRFSGNSKKQVAWFIDWMKRHNGVPLAADRPPPPDSSIQPLSRISTNPHPIPRTPSRRSAPSASTPRTPSWRSTPSASTRRPFSQRSAPYDWTA